MKRLSVLAALTLLTGLPLAQAASDAHGTASATQPSGEMMAPHRKPQVINRVRAREPMSGQMKRKGMTKEEVREQAMKKDALMHDAMEKEQPGK